MERLTTKEAAKLLGVFYSHAVYILHAASIPVTKIGTGFLWDREAVERLVCFLREQEATRKGSSK